MWNLPQAYQNFQKQLASGRFAPTPTGELHIGNAYTALLSLLSAHALGHKAILRIDDLDRRSIPKACLEGQLYDLAWLGLSFDEGILEGGQRGSYRQSERSDLYESALQKLNEQGLIYPCYCSRKDIAAFAPHAQDEGFVYPGTCRPEHLQTLNLEKVRKGRSDGKKPALRFNIKAFQVPQELFYTQQFDLRAQVREQQSIEEQQSREISYIDRVFGLQTAHLDQEIGDFVVQRKDGVYAYQLACAVDDMIQGCAFVVRGSDLITSTHRQRLMLSALEVDFDQMPTYAHAALVVDATGERLAKRNQSTQIRGLRESGKTASQIRASLSRALGGPDTDDLKKMIQAFSWDQLSTQPILWSL